MVKAAVPVLVKVTVIGALVVASSWLPKSRLMGANPTAGAVPFPLSATVCGLPPALSVTEIVRASSRESVGVTVTLVEQLAPAAKVAGLVGQALAPVLVAAKSPEAAKEVIVKAAVPVLVSVTVTDALMVASCWLPKPRLMGANPTAGAVPFPLSATVCGLPPALSVTEDRKSGVQGKGGVKVTLIEQLTPAAKVAGLVGQALAPVLVAAKSPEAAKEVIVKAAVPVLVSVTVTDALMVASGWLPKPRLVGANPTAGAVPFPLSATVCGLPPALSVTEDRKSGVQGKGGVKVTLIEQLTPAAKVAGLVGQALAPVLVAAKSPEAAKEVIVKAAVPVLVSVTVTDALMVASSWLPKPRLVGANPTAGAVPFPLSATVCGLPPALSVTDSVPVRAPEVVGVKVTLIEQLAPAAKVAGLVGQALAPVLVAAKSPEARSEERRVGKERMLRSVTVNDALMVASSWLPKPRLVGANPTAGAVPFPLSATVCGLPPALSVTESVAVRALEVVGVKVTLIEQLAPAAKVAGLVRQALAPVLVAAKSPEAAKELIVKAAVPVLVSVTVIGALVVASSWLPKSRFVGANPTAGAVPPLRLTF